MNVVQHNIARKISYTEFVISHHQSYNNARATAFILTSPLHPLFHTLKEFSPVFSPSMSYGCPCSVHTKNMIPTFLGACYLNCCAYLENPRPFQQHNDHFYCVVDVTIPTANSWLDTTFAIASLSYPSHNPHTSFLPGLYNVHTKVTTFLTITKTSLTVSR